MMLRHLAALLLLSSVSYSQTTSTKTESPTYFSTTGVRFDYYSYKLTETTNLGIRTTAPANTPVDIPAGFWVVTSIDATPRSQASSASLRLGARYFLKAVASGNVIAYAEVQEGATVTASSAAAGSLSGSTNNILNNLAGGMGFTWRVCHTFNSKAKVNCIVDFTYDLNSVSTQAVKPVVGFFVGLAF